jgi:hypothetical protein
MACLAAVAVAIGSGLLTMSTSSAVAKPTPAAATGTNIHQAPRAPFVVDGVRYAPEQISKFNGRPLYFIVDLAKPDQMTGYTNKTDFDTKVASSKATNTTTGGVGTQQAGQYVSLYSGDELTGDRFDLNSPYGVNYLAGVNRGCGLFGCAGQWDNVASSIFINGRVSVYDGIEYTGSWLYFQGYGYANLSWYGFDNITSSINVWW